jgi:transposase
MPYSSSLTDEEWKLIEPLLPQKKQTKLPRWTKQISKLQNKNKDFG